MVIRVKHCNNMLVTRVNLHYRDIQLGIPFSLTTETGNHLRNTDCDTDCVLCSDVSGYSLLNK